MIVKFLRDPPKQQGRVIHKWELQLRDVLKLKHASQTCMSLSKWPLSVTRTMH